MRPYPGSTVILRWSCLLCDDCCHSLCRLAFFHIFWPTDSLGECYPAAWFYQSLVVYQLCGWDLWCRLLWIFLLRKVSRFALRQELCSSRSIAPSLMEIAEGSLVVVQFSSPYISRVSSLFWCGVDGIVMCPLTLYPSWWTYLSLGEVFFFWLLVWCLIFRGSICRLMILRQEFLLFDDDVVHGFMESVTYHAWIFESLSIFWISTCTRTFF